MKREYLVEGPISPSLISDHLANVASDLEAGGHSLFLGQVRSDIVDNKKVVAIEYSAYFEMVEKEAEKIVSVTRAAFPDVRNIEIIHSTGLVKSGGLSLFVIVTAGHRDQAIRACRNVVELIKLNYPVWKKEIFEDSSHQWKENKV